MEIGGFGRAANDVTFDAADRLSKRQKIVSLFDVFRRRGGFFPPKLQQRIRASARLDAPPRVRRSNRCTTMHERNIRTFLRAATKYNTFLNRW